MQDGSLSQVVVPYKSQAQAAAMHAKADEGEISRSVIDEFDEASKGKKLPKKVKPIKQWANAKKVAQKL